MASSSRSWIYEVFLSFRGEDTRNTFVDHLYSALHQQGIYTYKDDETLPRGESIGPFLFKAIEKSRISVIIFSKNYADSSWCLEELAYIMKCRDERGQTVVPVFYDVVPSDVRKQEGEFGKAFAKQESKNMNKAESWRKALVDAANISGWEPKHLANGHESKSIKIIVDEISRNLHPLISSVDENLIGIEARMEDLKLSLKIGTGAVRMVGIWGVGGGGKTTLAYSIYNKISHEFDGCSFIENVREESSKFGLKKLQEKLISDVLKVKELYVGSVGEGKRMIKSRLRGRSVLIVLDDVDKPEHLEALVGSHDWFSERSRVIITTRDEHLLKWVDEIYGVSLLTHDEAIQLFRKHAYREYKPVEDCEKLSQDVVSYAGGLPLALKVLGSFLCDKDMDEWRSALARLKDIPDNDIVEKLKISYDGLKPIEKELFLDIACFFRRNRKDMVMEMLDACGFHPVIGVKVLIQKALITISNGVFEMHDLIQEMAHYIVREKHPNNPEKHSRVWQYEDVEKICYGDATMKNYKIEALLVYPDSPPNLLEVVANMEKLRFLHVRNPISYPLSSSTRAVDKTPEFLSNELRWFCWRGYPASSLPTKFQPTNLVVLNLKEGLQKQLWDGYKHMPNLKMLDLSFSKNLIRTPDFNGLPCLERMILKYCTNLEDIHPSIGDHERLVFLDLTECSKLRMLPSMVGMRKLETLLLEGCNQLIRNYPSEIEVAPSSIETSCLAVIFLAFKRKSPSSEHKELSFHNLVVLDFPRFLIRLDLSWCNLGDGDILHGICELSMLQILQLRGNHFSRLHFSLTQLSRLKVLDVSACTSLVKLPELPSSIVVLRARDCYALETLEDFPTTCKWLRIVDIAMPLKQCLIGSDRVIQSMLQGNAIENGSFFVLLSAIEIPNGFVKGNTFTLQLPHDWYSDFTGFLIFTTRKTNYDIHIFDFGITMKHEMGVVIDEDSQVDNCEESNDTPKYRYSTTWVGYVSFGRLRHNAWWNSTYNTISFSVHDVFDEPDVTEFLVELVPRKGKDGPTETIKATIDCSQFGDEDQSIYSQFLEVQSDIQSTFMIAHDSKSSLKIKRRHKKLGMKGLFS